MITTNNNEAATAATAINATPKPAPTSFLAPTIQSSLYPHLPRWCFVDVRVESSRRRKKVRGEGGKNNKVKEAVWVDIWRKNGSESSVWASSPSKEFRWTHSAERTTSTYRITLWPSPSYCCVLWQHYYCCFLRVLYKYYMTLFSPRVSGSISCGLHTTASCHCYHVLLLLLSLLLFIIYVVNI